MRNKEQTRKKHEEPGTNSSKHAPAGGTGLCRSTRAKQNRRTDGERREDIMSD